MGATEKREKRVGGKIKGSEFIFALIATELRNCLTSKIAPAQANYIHLLRLLALIPFLSWGVALFTLSRSLLSSLFLSVSSLVNPSRELCPLSFVCHPPKQHVISAFFLSLHIFTRRICYYICS